MPLPSYPYPHSAPTLDVPPPQIGQLGLQLQHLNQQAPLVQAQTEHLGAQTQQLEQVRQDRQAIAQKFGMPVEAVDAALKTLEHIHDDATKVQFINRVFPGLNLKYDPASKDTFHDMSNGVRRVFHGAGGFTDVGTPLPDKPTRPESVDQLTAAEFQRRQAKDPTLTLEDFLSGINKAKATEPKTPQFSARDQVYLDAALSGKNKKLAQSGQKPVTSLTPEEQAGVMDQVQRVDEKNKLDMARQFFYYSSGAAREEGAKKQVYNTATARFEWKKPSEINDNPDQYVAETPKNVDDIRREIAALPDLDYALTGLEKNMKALAGSPRVLAAMKEGKGVVSEAIRILGKSGLTKKELEGVAALKALPAQTLAAKNVSGNFPLGSDIRATMESSQMPDAETVFANPELALTQISRARESIRRNLGSRMPFLSLLKLDQHIPKKYGGTGPDLPGGGETAAPAKRTGPPIGPNWSAEDEARYQRLGGQP